jgi:hypothetical protein
MDGKSGRRGALVGKPDAGFLRDQAAYQLLRNIASMKGPMFPSMTACRLPVS